MPSEPPTWTWTESVKHRKATVDEYEVLFHQWGSAICKGTGHLVTVAICEFPDGEIQTVAPQLVRFAKNTNGNDT